MLESKYYGDPSEFDHQYRNKTRSESYENLLSETWHLPSGSRILDIASGVGDEAQFLKENYSATVFQTDISPNLSNLVRPESNFIFADFNNQPFRAESFDGVHCKDALVHVKSKNRFLNEAYRVLKPGGSFFLVSQENFDFITASGIRYYFVSPKNIGEKAEKIHFKIEVFGEWKPKKGEKNWHNQERFYYIFRK